MNTHSTFTAMTGQTPAAGTSMGKPLTDRDTISGTIDRFQPADQALLSVMMDSPSQDDALIDGLHRFLDVASKARFLNSLKLEQRGFWLGNAAPARLQIRLMEAARSSQHAAYQALRAGLVASGGLERAFPKV